MKIWLDDEFPPFKKYFLFPVKLPPPTDDWVWVKTAHEALEISVGQEVTDFAVDNDLGLRSAEGVVLMREIREMVSTGAAPQFANTTFYPITNNSGVAGELRRIFNDIYGFQGRL